MLAGAIVTISLLGSAMSLNIGRDSYNTTGLVRRENPADADLLASCPGGPKDIKLKRADKCTLNEPVNNPDVRLFTILGEPQLNCGGSETPIKVTLGGSTTVTQTTTINADFGLDAEGLKIGGGVSDSQSTATTTSKTIEFTVNPGRQAVFVAGVMHSSQTGNVKVNYGSKVEGHFIWFTGTTITQLTPKDDVVFDVHESDCGQDPRDLNTFTPSSTR